MKLKICKQGLERDGGTVGVSWSRPKVDQDSLSTCRRQEMDDQGRNAYQSRRAGRVIGLAMSIGHQNLDFVAGKVARFHVGPDDGLHQLDFVGKFGRKRTFSQSSVDRLHGSQNLGFLPFRHSTKPHSCKKIKNKLFLEQNKKKTLKSKTRNNHHHGLSSKFVLKWATLLHQNGPPFLSTKKTNFTFFSQLGNDVVNEQSLIGKCVPLLTTLNYQGRHERAKGEAARP